MLTGQGGAGCHQVGGGALEDDPAAVVAGARAEVDKYVADEACGFVAPKLSGIATLAEAADPGRLTAIRSDLPILLVSGTDDPLAGGGAAVELVAQRYRDAGVRDVQATLYPGARHELLNETNRDEVTADIIAFLDRTVGT